MKNVQKETGKTLEVVEPTKEGTTPTSAVPQGPSQRQEVENTLNYLNANYQLLTHGMFSGGDAKLLIQVQAWLENQQKALSLQMAKLIAAEATKDEQKNG